MELLVVMAVIMVLASLLLAAIGKVQENGNRTKETQAGRQLISAYLMAAADRDGELMPAHYEGRAPSLATMDLKHPDGTPLGTAELHRYPYRLMPYLNGQLDGTVLVGKNAEQIRKAFPGAMFHYGVSLCPAFGINYYFVGGYMVDEKLQGEGECATRMAQVEKPGSLIVFATAYTKVDGERIEGRFGVEPPAYRTALWDDNLHVDPRYGDKALCAFLDGSLRTYTVLELKDMRLWSKNAAATNNPDYRVAAASSGGLPGGGGRR